MTALLHTFSFTPPACRGASPLPYMKLFLRCGNIKEQIIKQIAIWPEQTCSYRGGYWMVQCPLESAAWLRNFSAYILMWKVLKQAKHLQFWNGEWENIWPVFLHIYYKCHTACSSKWAVKFFCWCLGVLAHPSFLACWSFFLTYWLVFSTTELRE